MLERVRQKERQTESWKDRQVPGMLELLDPDWMEEEDSEDQSYAASDLLVTSWKFRYSCFPY